jgi:LPS O-antigen subunit length determinant protein (WzzB/FepE family)
MTKMSQLLCAKNMTRAITLVSSVWKKFMKILVAVRIITLFAMGVGTK